MKRKLCLKGIGLCMLILVLTCVGKGRVFANSLSILVNPLSQNYSAGEEVTLKTIAEGEKISYEWQYSFDGTSWTKWASSETNEMRYNIPAEWNGIMYRCIVTDKNGNSKASEAAKLTLISGLKINQSPQSRTYKAGEEVTLKTIAEGEGISYEWQYSFDGTSWTKWASSETNEMRYNIPAEWNGIMYRCIVTDKYGNIEFSGVAVLTYINKEDWELPII